MNAFRQAGERKRALRVGLDQFLHVVLRLALQASANRGTLLAGAQHGRRDRGLRVRDVRICQGDGERNGPGAYSGEVFIHDSKTDRRSRTVPLTDRLRQEGHVINRKRVQRLMHLMGIDHGHQGRLPEAEDEPERRPAHDLPVPPSECLAHGTVAGLEQ